MASHDNWREILTTNSINLSNYIETEDGLKGELSKSGALPELTIKRIWGKPPSKRTFQLIADLKKRTFEDFKKFCEALKENKQAHIVKEYLTHVAPLPVFDVENLFKEVDLSKPQYKVLSEEKKGCLRQHLNELCDKIVSDKNFFTELEKDDSSFTSTVLNHLEEIEDEFKRNGTLINYISVGSEKRWADFCRALIATSQDSIVASYLNPSVPVNTKDVPAISTGFPISEKSSDVVSLVTREKFENQPDVMDVKFDIVTENFFKMAQKNVECKNAYAINGNLRGLAVIINNIDFEKKETKNLSKRDGANFDSKNLLNLFGQLKFHCHSYVNETKEGIKEILKEARTWEHHKQSDCFVLFILSHGLEGGVYGTDGESLLIKDIWKSFSAEKCPDLIGKPKMFFFQACQGGKKTTGYATDGGEDFVEIKSGEAGVTEDMKIEHDSIEDEMVTDAVAVKTVHELADMFIAHSVVDGYAAWRDQYRGSLYVRCFVDVLSREAHENDLHSMMVKVNSNLEDLCIPTKGGQMKQLAKIEHTLKRMNIYLLPEGNHHHYKSLKQNKVCNG